MRAPSSSLKFSRLTSRKAWRGSGVSWRRRASPGVEAAESCAWLTDTEFQILLKMRNNSTLVSDALLSCGAFASRASRVAAT